MNRSYVIGALVAVALAFVVVMLVFRDSGTVPPGDVEATAAAGCAGCTADCPSAGGAEKKAGLPKLVDLGSTTCIPCKQMEPVLEELGRDWADEMIVEFLDVKKNPELSKQYGIRVIPTQIFYDGEGKELFRHEGFMPRDAILGQWEQLGLPMSAPGS